MQCVKNAHEDPINDVDYNPNKPYHVVQTASARSPAPPLTRVSPQVTCGEDRQVRFWDLRKPSDPLKLIRKHTHW